MNEKNTEIDRYNDTVIIPTTAKYIGQYAFLNDRLTSLNLESTNIITIEQYSFYHCEQLKEVLFPSCLQEICKCAFSNCKNLKKIQFESDSKLKIIGDEAFIGCSELEIFEFPPLLETIGELAFCNSKFLICDLSNTKVRIIGEWAFERNSFVLLPATISSKSIINFCKFNIKFEIDEKHPVIKRDECGYINANGTIISENKEKRHFRIRCCVERIGKFCFNKSNLVFITIPSSVAKISEGAFNNCEKLKFVNFAKNSRLIIIGKGGFFYCSSIKSIKFPKSLKIIKEDAFSSCFHLEKVSFPDDSQLERIDEAFSFTKIKQFSFPPSVREIHKIGESMEKLKSIYVKNDLYESNKEGTAIFTKDRNELIFVINSAKYFEIPDGVRVLRKLSLNEVNYYYIPASVEVVEKRTFNYQDPNIIFSYGSRLRYLDFKAFEYRPKSLIINNENFVTKQNHVVISLNPHGIVFVPDHLEELEVDPNVEVIYAHAFEKSKIKRLHFTKSLKKIYDFAFNHSEICSITFEEGTHLDLLGIFVFTGSKVENVSLTVNDKLYRCSSINGEYSIELPKDFSCKHMTSMITNYGHLKSIICPRLSLPKA